MGFWGFGVEVQLQAIDKDLPPLFDAFNDDVDARTCPNCGTLHPGKVVPADREVASS